MMEGLYQSGDIAFIILAVMGLEALLLSRLSRRVPAVLTNLAAGACLILALRAALIDQSWQMIAAFLSLGFLFHATEIWQLWRMTRNERT